MLARVEPAYRERSIEHLAPAFIHGSEAEVLMGKHFADERSLAFPFQAALLRDPPYLDVFVIGQFRHTARIRAAARPVATGRRAVVQRFMRPLFVVNALELLERLLLCAPRGLRRLCRGLLQSQVHPLMPPIFLRRRRPTALRHNAQLPPPHRERLNPPGATEANGAPLSVWITAGRPNSRNAASKAACTGTLPVCSTAWQRNR